jgi:tetratricopeptide (TPR) repeat protein
MGGGPAIRGYLVQTLVALLDALDTDKDWRSVTLEPEHKSEKIDLLWEYPGRTKAVQVKSSVNPFEDADVKGWARDLETSNDADDYELVLVGTASKPAVAKARCLGRVVVPSPKILDLTAFRQQAAHLLHLFLTAEALPTGGPHCLEMLADALVGNLATLATKAHPFTRDKFVETLKTWIAEAPKDIPLFPLFDCPPRNPWFTGRGKEIDDLRHQLCQAGKAALGQAISGLGGIGKTQTAIEYGHRHRGQYDAVFWINAATDLGLETGYRKVAKLLRLPHDANNSDSVLAAVKRWLESTDGHGWLLIFDNADDPPLLKSYLPGRAPNGHILITSRIRLDVLGIRSPLSIEKLSEEDSTKFLLDRADVAQSDEQERQAARELARELDGLPLALEQAAAYVTAMRVTYGQYLASYRTRRLDLLERLGPVAGDYPATVAKTWLINFEQVEAASKAAGDLLRLSAMLDPNEIPFELLTKGAKELGQLLCEAINPSDPLSVHEVLEPLARFSLIGIDAEGRTYSIHRLVQEVVKDAMGDDGRRIWAERAVKAMNAAFPLGEVSDWPVCERLVSQAMAGNGLIKEFGFQCEKAANLLNQAGCYLRARGQFRLVEPLLRQAVEIRRQVLGEQHPFFATSLNNLAVLYRSTGRHIEAEPLYRQAMEIRRRVLGEQHPDFANSVNNLAVLYDSMGRYAEAETLYRQAMEIRRRVLGEQHPDFAISLNGLAGLYDSMGRYAEAEPLSRQAMEVSRQVLGEQHPDFANSLVNLAEMYRSAGRYTEAEPLCRQAMEIRRRVLGEQHPDFANSLNSLAVLYYLMGRNAEAEPLFRQAMEIDRQVLGERHPNFATSLSNLALLYDSTGRHIEAEPLYRQATEIRRQVLGEQHPDFATSLNNLALLYDSMGRYAEAEPLYRQAMEIFRQIVGEQHPDFAKSLNNLAALYTSARRYEEAEALFRQAVEIRRQGLGEQHPDFANSLNNLAGLYDSMGRYAEAEPLYRQATEIWLKTLGPNHPKTKTGQANYEALRRARESSHDSNG